MSVKELKSLLSNFPDDCLVFMAASDTGFDFDMLNSVRAEEIGFSEEPGGETLAKEMVIILDAE
jgi:hypothetical protein